MLHSTAFHYLDELTVLKSINPRSTSIEVNCTRTLSPTSRPSNPLTTFPSTGTVSSRTQVPLSDAPVTIESNCSPTRASSSSAAADLPTRRSTLLAASSSSVQCCASVSSSALSYGQALFASAAFNKRCVIRSG